MKKSQWCRRACGLGVLVIAITAGGCAGGKSDPLSSSAGKQKSDSASVATTVATGGTSRAPSGTSGSAPGAAAAAGATPTSAAGHPASSSKVGQSTTTLAPAPGGELQSQVPAPPVTPQPGAAPSKAATGTSVPGPPPADKAPIDKNDG